MIDFGDRFRRKTLQISMNSLFLVRCFSQGNRCSVCFLCRESLGREKEQKNTKNPYLVPRLSSASRAELENNSVLRRLLKNEKEGLNSVLKIPADIYARFLSTVESARKHMGIAGQFNNPSESLNRLVFVVEPGARIYWNSIHSCFVCRPLIIQVICCYVTPDFGRLLANQVFRFLQSIRIYLGTLRGAWGLSVFLG